MLDADRREVWRYGTLQRQMYGAGLILIRLQDAGSAPKEFSYLGMHELSRWPEPIVGMVNGLQAEGKGVTAWIVNPATEQWSLFQLSSDLSMTDVIGTYLQVLEDRANDKRKTKVCRRESGTNRADSNRWVTTSAKSNLAATDLPAGS